jgi:hypothetical protein
LSPSFALGVREVPLDGLRRQHEPAGDLATGHPLGGELGDLPLGGCQLVTVGGVARAGASRDQRGLGASGERLRSALPGELVGARERFARLGDAAAAGVERAEVGERPSELEPVDRGLTREIASSRSATRCSTSEVASACARSAARYARAARSVAPHPARRRPARRRARGRRAPSRR